MITQQEKVNGYLKTVHYDLRVNPFKHIGSAVTNAMIIAIVISLSVSMALS